ncbi:MAG: tyramine oxidase subunit B [Anaerostipes hadrus]|nr:tyramine oxidase subunit B [Anaerostipes hadrus]
MEEIDAAILEEKMKLVQSKKLRLLYLDEEDMIEAGVLDAAKCVDIMEETIGLLEDGDFIMGGPEHNSHGIMLEFPKKSNIKGFPVNDGADRRFIAMPAYLGGKFHVAGCKWYGSNGNNRRMGIPRSNLMFILNDVETGAPLAFMAANLLSSARTGAMPGLAAKLLAKKDSKILTMLGAGPIAKACFRAIMTNMTNIDTVKIKAGSLKSKTAAQLKEYIEKYYKNIKKVIICETLEEAVRESDIISESVSVKPGQYPTYKKEWFKPGATLIATSFFDMDKRELIGIRKVVDNWKMYEEYGIEDQEGYDENGFRNATGCMGEEFYYMVEDKLITRDSIDSLGEIIRGKKPARTSDDEVIFVAIEGMPIEDVAWGHEVYLTAKEKGIGQQLKVWDHHVS